jgi:cytochrome c biogenesis protein CcdA
VLSSALLTVEDGGVTVSLSLGSLFVLGACCCWGMENNCTRMLSRSDPQEIVVVKGLGSGAGALLVALLSGEPFPALQHIPAALLLGLVVSSLELVCTGQIYLPVIVALNASGFNLKAFLWLLLYNLAFIAPLVAVTLLAYCGVGVNAIAKWARNNVFATKIAMSLLFVLIAALMLMLIFFR